MKFILFNMVVGGALVFLLTFHPLPTPQLESQAAVGATETAAPTALVSQPRVQAKEPAAAPLVSATDPTEIEREAEPVTEHANITAVSPRLNPNPVLTPQTSELAPPEAKAIEPEPEFEPDHSEPVFMSATERGRELRALARDVETQFLSTVR